MCNQDLQCIGYGMVHKVISISIVCAINLILTCIRLSCLPCMRLFESRIFLAILNKPDVWSKKVYKNENDNLNTHPSASWEGVSLL